MALELGINRSNKNSPLKKAEERLQLNLKRWQDERAALQKTIEMLQNTVKEKQREWSETESDMVSRVNNLDKVSSKRNAERKKIKEEEEMLAGQALQMLWIQLITSSAVEGDLALWALMTFVFVWYVQV